MEVVIRITKSVSLLKFKKEGGTSHLFTLSVFVGYDPERGINKQSKGASK